MILHFLRRDVATTLDRSNELIALAEEFGLRIQVMTARPYRGWARAETGDVEQGIAEIQRGIVEFTEAGWADSWGAIYAMLAECLRQSRRRAEALDAIDRGLELSRETRMACFDAELHRLRGEMLADQDTGGAGAAEGEFLRALEIARRQEAKLVELRAATSLARLWQSQGRRDEARALLAPIHEWFTEGFDTQDLKNARTLLEQLSA